jgi:kynureninase
MDEAIIQIGAGALTEESVQHYIAPLFSRALSSDRIYHANHSLGRPLDAMANSEMHQTRKATNIILEQKRI